MIMSLECSFSAVSKPIVARNGAFFFAFFEIYKICILLHRSKLNIRVAHFCTAATATFGKLALNDFVIL